MMPASSAAPPRVGQRGIDAPSAPSLLARPALDQAAGAVSLNPSFRGLLAWCVLTRSSVVSWEGRTCPLSQVDRTSLARYSTAACEAKADLLLESAKAPAFLFDFPVTSAEFPVSQKQFPV
jgi:hypothetical protein